MKIFDDLDDLPLERVRDKKHAKVNFENVATGHISKKKQLIPEKVIEVSEDEVHDEQNSQLDEKLMEQSSYLDEKIENDGKSFEGCCECLEYQKEMSTLKEQLTRVQNFLLNTQIGNKI